MANATLGGRLHNHASSIDVQPDGIHLWGVVNLTCDLANQDDQLVIKAAQALQNAYGVDELIQLAQTITPDPEVAAAFDLSKLKKGILLGLPDPKQEGNKPPALANFRSEPAEVVGRHIASHFFKFDLPPANQATKGNANQPILGVDGWGFKTVPSPAFVMIQVKASDEKASPPQVVDQLCGECQASVTDRSIISRTLAICATRSTGTPYEEPILQMLEQLGDNIMPSLIACAIVVRGMHEPAHSDLTPIRDIAPNLNVPSYGLSVAIGADLPAFGKLVMDKARTP